MKRNCIIGQSGGPTIAINASLAGIIHRAKASQEFENVYGMINGIKGLLEGRYMDLLEEFDDGDKINALKQTPAMYLGSCRYKLPTFQDDEDTYVKLFRILKELEITDFFYIGGNDSMDTVMKLDDYAKYINSDIHFIGIPKTIDNDLMGTDHTPGFDIFTSYANFDFSNFVFNLVFCATTATIVSGAMAERTKFLSYCVYSGVISALIYPIEAHWIWGGGWLSQLGFHDFAGSCAIHMVGGISALIGAKIIGPRIGKFDTDKNGKVVKVNAIPGHNITAGALGVFILWLGWYGFNGAAATTVPQLGSIFVTTTVAPAIATVSCLIFTWIKYGKPDVGMCLNASLAGLVAITAGCDVTDVLGSIIIGAVAGLLVCLGVWFLDYKLHIDDPVGAVAVHCCNGIWGTIAVGLFATTSAPESTLTGLFYGGGFDLLIKQLTGVLSVGIWTAITITITFFIIKKIFGLRVSEREEIIGLDLEEHGCEAYPEYIKK